MTLKKSPKISKEKPFQLPDFDEVKAEAAMLDNLGIGNDEMEDDETSTSKTSKQDFRLKDFDAEN